jgi:hypothetical protein
MTQTLFYFWHPPAKEKIVTAKQNAKNGSLACIPLKFVMKGIGVYNHSVSSVVKS